MRALKIHIEPVAQRIRHIRLLKQLALWWFAAAIVAVIFAFVQKNTGPILKHPVLALALVAAAGACILWWRSSRTPLDLHEATLEIERFYPDLHTLLLAATQLTPAEDGKLNYLQQRVVDEAQEHGRNNWWLNAVPKTRITLARALNWTALALFAISLASMKARTPPSPLYHESIAAAGVFISPGDTNIEKGGSLVVLARFSGVLPEIVNLVLQQASSDKDPIPMFKNLSDPIFGGSVRDLSESFEYRVEYGMNKTRSFKVSVFEYPRLARADAEIVFPDYTGLPRKRIEDTRRITAVQGSLLNLAIQLNKPVSQARLVGKDKSIISLQTDSLKANAHLDKLPLDKSMSYELLLVDADGRTNKMPAGFAFEVLTNRTPQLKLVSPAGDVRPSALEEVRFEGEVWDDFGIHSYGMGYAVGGGAIKNIILGTNVPGTQKKQFKHILALEDLGVKPGDFIAYHIWADDAGPDGKIRRKASDIYFAEVRPFDEIFRQGQPQDENQQENQEDPGNQGEGNQAARLVELQKQILSATWKLQQQYASGVTDQYRKDETVVQESQDKALSQAESASEKANDPKQQSQWTLAITGMKTALAKLKEAANTTSPLPEALIAEQEACQALLKLQAREHEITQNRSRNRNRNSGSGQAQSRRQMDQMELTDAENRYETQRQASPKMTEERRGKYAGAQSVAGARPASAGFE